MLLAVIVVGGYFIQQQLLPDIDPALIKPVEILDSAGDSSPESELANLPAGAITRMISQSAIDDAEHPFDPLLELAAASIKKIDANIFDYKATMVSQVFADGKLQPEKYLLCKIRHQRTVDDNETPFSVYTLFLKPKANAGQEAIWVKGWNEGKLVAHANGLKNLIRVYLPPDGSIAMKGNRYPIRQIGIRNLLVKMSEIGKHDREYGECTVTLKRNVEINGCQCSVLEAKHPVKRDHFDFHIARIYIDDERNIPIAYEGFSWPEKAGDEPPLLEKYYYTDIEFNVGLKNIDFDPANEEYNYPRW